MLKFETKKSSICSCDECPLKNDCDQMCQYTICELLNIPEDEVIVNVIKI